MTQRKAKTSIPVIQIRIINSCRLSRGIVPVENPDAFFDWDSDIDEERMETSDCCPIINSSESMDMLLPSVTCGGSLRSMSKSEEATGNRMGNNMKKVKTNQNQ